MQTREAVQARREQEPMGDWLVLIWAVFVLAVYIGGYLFGPQIGLYTSNLQVIFAIALIAGIATFALRWRKRSG